jgi:hypothetical protein
LAEFLSVFVYRFHDDDLDVETGPAVDGPGVHLRGCEPGSLRCEISLTFIST